MLSNVIISDPQYSKPEKYNVFDRFFLKLIVDERDLPFVHLSLKILLTLVPFAVLLYLPLPALVWWPLAILYPIYSIGILNAPYTLMLHCTSHRPFFKNEYKILNEMVPWVFGPFFGQSPGTYYSHHMGMHHAENNLEDDLSSTMKYQRDSFKDFMKYFTTFFFGVIADLVNYHHARKRLKMRNKVLKGEVFFLIFCIGMFILNPLATSIVFVFPLLLVRFLMMVGNWAQHSFVDFDEPGNCYKNSITCVNTIYNRQCFNDGYHIGHHLKPTMHYTQYPQHFMQNINEFGRNKALVFNNLHYAQVWFYLMRKDYKTLAAHLVNINNAFANDAEAIAVMQARTRKMEARGINARNYKATVAAA